MENIADKDAIHSPKIVDLIKEVVYQSLEKECRKVENPGLVRTGQGHTIVAPSRFLWFVIYSIFYFVMVLSRRMFLLVNILLLLQKCYLLLLRRRALRLKAIRRTRRRWWVRPAWRGRLQQGCFRTLIPTMQRDDRECYFRYMRMSPEKFQALLKLVKPHLPRRAHRRRDQLTDEERLAITIRYLATGNSQSSQSFSFMCGRSTISQLVRDVCAAIWKALNPVYLRPPKNRSEYEAISKDYFDLWDFPHVLGSVDGKHVQIDCPAHGGSDYYNRKGYHSTILMAVCDARYRFTHVSIGSYGKESDATIFRSTSLFQSLETGKEHIPKPKEVTEGHLLPYVLLGDDIFPLKSWFMKPFPGKSDTVEQRVFNYRLSRARRTIENAFGILAARWRIFRRPINAKTDLIDLICQATVCLHNYLLSTESARYLPTGFADSYADGQLLEGDWRKITGHDGNPGLHDLHHQGSHNYTLDAKQTREAFSRYVNGPGALPWQDSYVRYAGPQPDEDADL